MINRTKQAIVYMNNKFSTQIVLFKCKRNYFCQNATNRVQHIIGTRTLTKDTGCYEQIKYLTIQMPNNCRKQRRRGS